MPEEFEHFTLFDCYIAGQPGDGTFVIYEFGSHTPGKGNAAKALSELKRLYGYIAVTDIGYPGDESYNFWMHALSKGLVDEVNDDQGARHVAEQVVERLLQEAPDLDTLKKNRKTLTPEEKAAFKGCSQDQSATAMKSVVNGKTWYVCYTHRAYKTSPTLKGALKEYPKIASTG